MPEANIDLTKIKAEMDSRRSERNNISERLGESVRSTNNGGNFRDQFLGSLLTSFHTGQETSATQRVKTIENKVDRKLNKKPTFAGVEQSPINETINPRTDRYSPNLAPSRGDLGMDREELMYNDFMKKAAAAGNNTSLSSALGEASGGRQSLNEYGGHNDGNLNENIKRSVNNYLSENFGPIIEESIKNNILEMYAVTRIKEVISENEDIIRKVVLKVLREIQEKKKSNF